MNLEKNHTKTIPLQTLFYFFLVFTFLWFGPMFMISMGIHKYLIFFISAIPSFLLLATTFTKLNSRFDPFEPINFVLLALFFGTTLRSYWLLTTSRYGDRQSFILYGENPEFLIYPAIYITFAMCFFVLGYYPKVTPIKLDTISTSFRKPSWNIKRVQIIVVILSVISIIGAILFFQKVGVQEITLDTFSQKRRTFLDDERTQRVSYVYYRWAASLIKFPYYLSLIYFAFSGKKFFSRYGVLVFFLGLLAMLFPFMTSLRSELIYVVINTLLIWNYSRGFPYVLFGFSVPMVALVLYGMLMLRTLHWNSSLQEQSAGEAIIETVVGNSSMLGIAKTGHIIHAVPNKLEYAYGTSMLTIILAPIPRTMWNDKPNMNPGATIKQKVLPEKNKSIMGGGIPPGSVAELYWNFGIFGITLGMFLLGRLLKFAYKSFVPWLARSPNALFLYICFTIRISYVLMGESFAQATMQAGQEIIPAILILKFLNGRKFVWKLSP